MITSLSAPVFERRLGIDNVPGLVRFAVATGLVSAEPSAEAAA